MTLSAGVNFAGFTIVRLLGAGGMGEVYLAEHPRLNRRDALKILPAAYAADGEYRRRFAREADLAAALWHPNIIGVHDRGEFDGQLWISMDYVDGTDAATLRRNRYPAGMPRTDVVEIVTAIGAALDFAHQRNLLHRDVKPANILLTTTGDQLERILLADFGIARNLTDATRLTATSMAVGTLSYAAPEQLAGEQLSGSADQYALAGTAYHLLVGAPPFDDPSPAVVIARHLSAPVPPISMRRPELADLDAVFARALAKDPSRRYPTSQDFAAALDAGAQRSTVAVPPPLFVAAPKTPDPSARPITPRIPAAAAALTVVGVLLIGTLVWVGFLLGRPGHATSAVTQPTSLVRVAPPAPVPTTAQPASSPAPPPQMVLPDADQQGFFTGGARCDSTDRAAFMVRTEYSTAVVCATTGGQYYYRGARASDGATIELTHVERTGIGFTAVNDTDPTYYELSRGGLRIVQGGQVLSTEPAVESGP